MDTVNIVLPVFLVIGAGYLLGATGFLSQRLNKEISKLVFYVAAPCVLFRSAASTPLDQAFSGATLAVTGGVTVAVTFLVYLACWRSPASRRGVLSQGAYRSNMVFVGLPIIMNAYGDSALGPAAVLISFMVVIYNLLAVLVLSLPHRSGSTRIWGTTLFDMVKNPLIIGCGLGILLSATDLGLPVLLNRSCELIGRIAAPLALLSVGAGLDLRKLGSEWAPALLAALIKLVLYPMIVYFCLLALGFSGLALQVPVLIMASPTAVVSYIMAKEMRGDERLAAAIVIGTTLGSLFSLSGWLLYFL